MDGPSQVSMHVLKGRAVEIPEDALFIASANLLILASGGQASTHTRSQNALMEPFYRRITDVIGEFEVDPSFPCRMCSVSSGSPHKPNVAPPSCDDRQHAHVKQFLVRSPATFYWQLGPHSDGYVSSLGAVLRPTFPRREVRAQNMAEDGAATGCIRLRFSQPWRRRQVGVEYRMSRKTSLDRFS